MAAWLSKLFGYPDAETQRKEENKEIKRRFLQLYNQVGGIEENDEEEAIRLLDMVRQRKLMHLDPSLEINSSRTILIRKKRFRRVEAMADRFYDLYENGIAQEDIEEAVHLLDALRANGRINMPGSDDMSSLDILIREGRIIHMENAEDVEEEDEEDETYEGVELDPLFASHHYYVISYRAQDGSLHVPLFQRDEDGRMVLSFSFHVPNGTIPSFITTRLVNLTKIPKETIEQMPREILASMYSSSTLFVKEVGGQNKYPHLTSRLLQRDEEEAKRILSGMFPKRARVSERVLLKGKRGSAGMAATAAAVDEDPASDASTLVKQKQSTKRKTNSDVSSSIEENCPICTEELVGFILTCPTCLNSFHRTCLYEYSKTKKSQTELPCPICRSKYAILGKKSVRSTRKKNNKKRMSHKKILL